MHMQAVAVVGIGCRFPGADGPQAFWKLLVDGSDATTEVPADRFDINAFHDPGDRAPGKIRTRLGGFVDCLGLFDAGFFAISPREAEAMDPQQRILLQVAYEAMEDAGMVIQESGFADAGVFLGIISDDYQRHVYNHAADLDLTQATASSRGTAAARIARALGLAGPSLVVDSDRASSLTAVHLACRSLNNEECRIAFAGGGNAILGPDLSIACSRSGILSPDGHCKFCDSRADGIVRSEGFGVVALKLLSDAEKNGDRIYAVIRGSAIGSNGTSSFDLMQPCPQAQENLLRLALRNAGVAPSAVAYVEAHGTGTQAGDKAEIEALGAVYGKNRGPDQPCMIGSVKTNIGHTEGAAGIAGLIKVALALRHGLIPGSLHCQNPNPALRLEEQCLKILSEKVRLPVDPQARTLAGVSAFGLTGAMAHVVMEAPPVDPAQNISEPEPECQPFVLSARSWQALDALAEKYCEHLRQSKSPLPMGDFCYSSATRRSHHAYRLGLVAATPAELIQKLAGYVRNDATESVARGECSRATATKIAFVFPGQGSQWPDMAKELLAREPVFRGVIQSCEELIAEESGFSLINFLQGKVHEDCWEQIDFVQPALTAVMIGLAAVWKAWGIEPGAVVGLSMGEIAAAHVAGILTTKDAMAIVCRRTRLMKRRRAEGAIASVPLSLIECEEAMIPFGNRLSVAVAASPLTTVLSGERQALKDLLGILEERGISGRYVNVDVASHSAQMDGQLEELRERIADITPQAGAIPFLSTVDDTYLSGQQLGPAYWSRNLRQPVLQHAAITRLLNEGYTAFLEISPHPIAWHTLFETLQHCGSKANIFHSLRRNEGGRETLLKSLVSMHVHGISPQWDNVFRNESRRFVPLPTYPWQNRHYWFEGGKQIPTTAANNGEVTKQRSEIAPAPDRSSRLLNDLRSAAPTEQHSLLVTYLQRLIARVMKIADPSSIGICVPLRQMGLTSLMSVELAVELQQALNCVCPASLVFNYPTIADLAPHLLKQVVAESPKLDAPAQIKSGTLNPPHNQDLVTPAGLATANAESIAVIGIGCRFPGKANSPDQYWEMLRAGVDAVTDVPGERWNMADFYSHDPETPGKMYTRCGAFLDSIDQFDANYFGVSPREAEALDPQQRLLLEVSVEALEHAGHAPRSQTGTDVGVFIGIMNNHEYAGLKGISSDPSLITAHDSTGRSTAAAAGRLSYTFGFQGPSVAIDTACSSSLVAIHQACQSLRLQECRVALAGGVNVILSPETTISYCKTRMLSPTGRCKTFDAAADGYVRGEGCGIVVLFRPGTCAI